MIVKNKNKLQSHILNQWYLNILFHKKQDIIADFEKARWAAGYLNPALKNSTATCRSKVSIISVSRLLMISGSWFHTKAENRFFLATSGRWRRSSYLIGAQALFVASLIIIKKSDWILDQLVKNCRFSKIPSTSSLKIFLFHWFISFLYWWRRMVWISFPFIDLYLIIWNQSRMIYNLTLLFTNTEWFWVNRYRPIRFE